MEGGGLVCRWVSPRCLCLLRGGRGTREEEERGLNQGPWLSRFQVVTLRRSAMWVVGRRRRGKNRGSHRRRRVSASSPGCGCSRGELQGSSSCFAAVNRGIRLLLCGNLHKTEQSSPRRPWSRAKPRVSER